MLCKKVKFFKMNTFDKAYRRILLEGKMNRLWNPNAIKAKSRGIPSIETVKEELLKLSGCSSWEDFVNMQQSGDCDMIAKTVARMFPKIKMVSVIIEFCENAIKQMEQQDNPDMYKCSHFLNKLNGKYLDFGKGTNRYENVYVLDGEDDMYSCEYKESAVKYLTDERLEDPKQLGTTLR